MGHCPRITVPELQLDNAIQWLLYSRRLDIQRPTFKLINQRVKFKILMQRAQARAHNISQRVMDHIRSNRLQPGDQLPTESDMAGTLGINRSTLREVYVQMLGQGLILRQHGKGTFVGQAPIKDGAVTDESFAGRIGAAGFSPTVDVVHTGRVPLDAMLAREFGFPVGTLASRLLRLYRANQTPAVLVDDFFAPSIDGDRIDLGRYGLDMIAGLHTQVDLVGAHLNMSTTAVSLPEDKALLLGLGPQVPALLTYGVLRTRQGATIAVAWAWLNPLLVEVKNSRIIMLSAPPVLAVPGEVSLVHHGHPGHGPRTIQVRQQPVVQAV